MVFFKYLLKFLRRNYFKLFMLLGIFIMFLFVFGLYNNVFGATTWTDSNNVTWTIPDYTVTKDKYVVICSYTSNTQGNAYWKTVTFFECTSNCDFYLKYNSTQKNFSIILNSTNGSDFTYTIKKARNSSGNATTWNYVNNENQVASTGSLSGGQYNATIPISIYTANTDIKLYDNNNQLVDTIYTSTVEPYIENSSTDIKDWSFDNLSINYGTLNYDNRDYLHVTYFDSVTSENLGDFDLNLSLYTETIGAGSVVMPINIPQQRLNNTIVFKENFKIGFILVHFTDSQGSVDTYPLSDSPYTVSISSSYADNLNNNADRTIQNDILNENKETNLQLQNLNDSINDDNIDVTANDLPSIDVSSPTDSGLNNIFQNLYNAFCTGQAQDIVFPIPFTNKNITLSPYYVRDMLNNNNASWVYTFIQAFWGYLIGRYIIKDITNKIDKIKSGDVENVENSNIKEDML